MKKNIIHNLTFVILFLLAFSERTLFDLGPNFEFITAFLILSFYYLGVKKSFWATFLLVALTDRFIGNSIIFLFTWSGFLIPMLVLPKLFRGSKPEIRNSVWKLISLTGSGVVANIFFYIHTNLGVWLLDSWGMYSKDLSGIIYCYINALPFLKNQILSTLFTVPVGYLLIELTTLFLQKTNQSKTPFISIQNLRQKKLV